jgi:hypothetical protein
MYGRIGRSNRRVHRGSTGSPALDDYAPGENASRILTETVIGLYKTEVIHRRVPWRNLEAMELRNGSTGSHRPSSKHRTISPRASCRWRSDQIPESFEKAGAVQPILAPPDVHRTDKG